MNHHEKQWNAFESEINMSLKNRKYHITLIIVCLFQKTLKRKVILRIQFSFVVSRTYRHQSGVSFDTLI
jgi:hypothetical protein